MGEPTSDLKRARPDRPCEVEAGDGLEWLLAIVQLLLCAYAVVAYFSTMFGVGFVSGPTLGLLALAWRDHGMIWAEVVVTIAALLAATRIGRLSYAPYVWMAVGHFCLTVSAFAVLASVRVIVGAAPQRPAGDLVRIDADWPIEVVPWFLFCNPVLIGVIVRAARRSPARASAAVGG